MKNLIKYIFIIMIILGTFGCKNKDNDSIIDNNAIIKLDNIDIKINKNTSLDQMNFYYPDDANITNTEDNYAIEYKIDKDTENETLLFSIMISEFKNTSIEEVMKNTTATEITNKEINGINWSIYKTIFESKSFNTYVFNYNGNTYAIDFLLINSPDIVEEEFINRVSFK